MAIENLEQLNEMHIDVLREIGNIGAGNAATSLSQMLDREVDMTTPNVRILDISDAANALGGPEMPVVAILAKLEGDVTGIMVFLIEQEFTQGVLATLLGESEAHCECLTDLERSAIAELGNIMMSAYVNSIGTMAQLNMKISVPAVTADMVGAILCVPAIEMGSVSDKIIFIQDDFLSSNRTVSANMMLIPDIESLNRLMTSLGIEL